MSLGSLIGEAIVLEYVSLFWIHSGNGANTVSESTASNIELSEFSGPQRVPGRELSELLSAYCGVQNDYVLGFIVCGIFTGFASGIFTVIPGCPRRASGDSQYLEARPELQDWLQSELFTVKNYRTGPFSK